MNKKKLMTTIMLAIVIALASAVAVSAAVDFLGIFNNFKGSKLQFMLVNTIVVAIAAFFLQGFLIPKEGENEMLKKGMPIIALAIGALIAWQFGMEDWIWKVGFIANLFHLKVFVNIIVVSGVLYLIKGIFIKNASLDNKQAKMAIGLLVLVIASMMALQPFKGGKTWDEVEDTYTYVWERPMGIKAKFFLLGSKDSANYTLGDVETAIKEKGFDDYTEKEPDKVQYGILKPPSLFISIGATLLFVWLFTTILNIQQGNKEISWVLSVLLGTEMAKTGMSIATFATMAQIFALFIFYKQMSKSGTGKFDWGAALWSAFIVFTVMSLAFPQYSLIGGGLSVGGGEGLKEGEIATAKIVNSVDNIKINQAGFIGGILNIALGIIKVGVKIIIPKTKVGLIWRLAVTVIIAILVFFKRKSKNSRFLRDAGKTVNNALVNAGMIVAPRLLYRFNKKEKIGEGQFADSIKANLYKIWTLQNWMLRHHVFLSKKNAVVTEEGYTTELLKALPKTEDLGYNMHRVALRVFKQKDRHIVNEEKLYENDAKIRDLYKTSLATGTEAEEVEENADEYNDAFSTTIGIEEEKDPAYDKEKKRYAYYDDNTGLKHKLPEEPQIGSLSGWKLVFTIYNRAFEWINANTTHRYSGSADDVSRFTSGELLSTETDTFENFREDFNIWKREFKKYGAYSTLDKGVRLEYTDQYLMFGITPHSYRVAHGRAKTVKYNVAFEGQKEAGDLFAKRKGTGKLEWNIEGLHNKSYEDERDESKHPILGNPTYTSPDEDGTKDLLEVDMNGFILKDLNKIKKSVDCFFDEAEIKEYTEDETKKYNEVRRIIRVDKLRVDKNELNRYGSPMDEVTTDEEKETLKNEPHLNEKDSVSDYIKIMRTSNPYRANVAFFESSAESIAWLDTEWRGFLDNMRAGIEYPNSKTQNCYVSWIETTSNFRKDAIKKVKNVEYLQNGRTTPGEPPSLINPAYDEEGFNHPGFMPFWGKENFNDNDVNTNNTTHAKLFQNPYPGLSSAGLSWTIQHYLTKKAKDQETMLEQLKKFIWFSTDETQQFSHNPKDKGPENRNSRQE